jgi:hypothetical protein
MNRIVTYSLSYAAYVAFMHGVHGPWRKWKVGYEGRAVDPWTLQHVLWGFLAQRWGLTQKQLLVLGAANELVEYWARVKRPDLLWGTPETVSNVAADLGAAAMGYWISDTLSGSRR